MTSSKIHAEQRCKDLPGFKKIGKDSAEYIECLLNKAKEVKKDGKFKLKTDSKLTDWIKKQIK